MTGGEVYDLFSVAGKRALVTGGSAGLGRAMAEALRQGGAQVAIAGRSERVYDVAGRMDVFPLQVDLAQPAQAEGLVERAVDVLGGLDVLINNAGMQWRQPAETFSRDAWRQVLAVNLEAVWVLCQAAGRIMLAQGQGKIINTASAMSFLGGYTIPAYAASKGGVAQLTKALSNEWAGRGVQVNAIAPGYMRTSMTADLESDPVQGPLITARIPAGRWGEPADLKGAVIFLASAASDYVSGAIIAVDGGFLGR